MIIDTEKPILVTGATGYVAGRLVELLLEKGHTVHAAVRDPENKEKTKYLDALAQKHSGNIVYFKSNLLEENSYFEAMQGCELVFHTASPFIRIVKDPQLDLVDPAVKGTENVLHSVDKSPSVKRVVLTSSCASIYGDAKDVLTMPDMELSENVWNTTSSLSHQPYSFSKVEAEKAAWKIAENQKRWSLVVINPSFVLGPGVNPFGTSESFAIMKQLASGDFKMGIPEFNIGCIDVRDLAIAHYKAGITSNAEGRFIISGSNSSFKEIGQIVKDNFPKYKISTKKLPKFLLWLVAPTVGMTRKEVSLNIGYPWKANTTKSVDVLGMTYRPLKETIVEFFEQLKDAGALD